MVAGGVRIVVATRHIEAAVETSASAGLAFVAVPEQKLPHPLADLRFRTLVGEAAWARLPDARTHLLARACRDRSLVGGGRLFAAMEAFP